MSEGAQPGLIEALGGRAVVRGWAEGAQILALVESVHHLGWLERLARPTPVEDLTSETWPAERVRGVTNVLKQAGVLTEVPGGNQLTPAFAALVNGSSGVSLDTVLAAVHLDLTALEDLDQEDESVGGGLIVALDSGVEADPVTQALYRSVYDEIPEVAAVLDGPGPMLDLGCGIGGALLTTARLYPSLKLVGVDSDPLVAAEAARRRDLLGLADRVEIRCQDARSVGDRALYPIAYWAQAFFADAARAAVLDTLRQALTEGGLLILQALPATGIEAVVAGGRGVTAGRTADDLAEEAGKAGFSLVRQVTTNLGDLTVLTN